VLSAGCLSLLAAGARCLLSARRDLRTSGCRLAFRFPVLPGLSGLSRLSRLTGLTGLALLILLGFFCKGRRGDA